MKLGSFFKSSIVLFAFVCLSPLVKAEPGGGGEDPDPGQNGTAVPFDFGLSALVAAGIGYAVKKKYDSRKKEKAGEEIQKQDKG